MSCAEMLYRTDFFPGLGWMMLVDTWLELRPKWPNAYVYACSVSSRLTYWHFRCFIYWNLLFKRTFIAYIGGHY